MTSSVTGITLAMTDAGANYKKARKLFNNTAGFDASSGGVFVVLSGAGVVQSGGSADVYGIILDAVGSAASGDDRYVDVYMGLQDLFEATLANASGIAASADVNGANLYSQTLGTRVGNGTAGLDIVGTIDMGSEAVADGGRVRFRLTPSEAIAGYDSGNTT